MKITTWVCLHLLPVTYGAVIEVTAGGSVAEPTYRFSDDSGSHLANLTAKPGGSIHASGDVVTASGNSINACFSLFSYVGARLQGTSTPQSFPVDTMTIVNLAGVDLSSGANVDTSNSRFAAVGTAAAGYYSCTGQINPHNVGNGQSNYALYKNGVEFAHGAIWVMSNYGNTMALHAIPVTGVVHLNGAGD
jgi:hypothetical protein